jgi:hypothetical protein
VALHLGLPPPVLLYQFFRRTPQFFWLSLLSRSFPKLCWSPLGFFMGGPLKWLQPLPVEVWLHETVGLVLQGRGRVRFPQSAFFFSWMCLRIFWMRRPSIAAFLRCLLSWHPGDFRSLKFGCCFCRSDPWRALSVPFHKWMGVSLGDALHFGIWSGALTHFRSFHAL